MEKKEKVEFLLEQMRLCFQTKDYIRTQIISKKVSTKYFEEKDTEELKLRYYRQMIDLNLHHKDFLSVSKNFFEIYSTDCVKGEEEKWKEVCSTQITQNYLYNIHFYHNSILHWITGDLILYWITGDLILHWITGDLFPHWITGELNTLYCNIL